MKDVTKLCHKKQSKLSQVNVFSYYWDGSYFNIGFKALVISRQPWNTIHLKWPYLLSLFVLWKTEFHFLRTLQNLPQTSKLISCQNFLNFSKLSRCASCVARCIPPCDLCAYFRNPQGQTISSWILVYLCVCPTISTALKVFGPKKY